MGICKPVHVNSSVGFESKEIDVLANSDVLLIDFYNSHNSNRLLVSFDGKNWRQIKPSETWTLKGAGEIPIHIDQCYVKGSDMGTTYEITILKLMKEWPIM